MIHSLKNYVYDRRKGLAKTAGFVGGAYLLQRYVSDRLAELKTKLEEERMARENLRRRFQTAADDVSFTVLAVLPTLAEQVMEGMDVEALTQELQIRSKARTAGSSLLRQTLDHHDSNNENDNNLARQEREKRVDSSQVDATSSVGSTASTSFIEAPSQDGESSGMNSWIETSASGPSFTSTSFSGVPSPPQHPPRYLSDSVITLSTTTTASSNGGNEVGSSDSVTSMSTASDTTASKTKAELWAEVKMLTFTRTLTTLYSMTLLSLLTTIQLSILARFKYINSMLELEREERLQEQLQSHLNLSISDLLFKSKIQDLLSMDLFDPQDDAEKGEIGGDLVTEEVERKFLTLSWWILHVGWKDVGERVRRGVEEVFEGVSLKTKLAAIDLHRLVRDVRRRVEHEITFEGQERRVNFLSTLLPPTPEMIQHVLTQGGFISELPLEPHTVVAAEQAIQDTTTLTSSQLSHEFDASPATGLSGLFNNPNNPHNVAPLPSSSTRPVIPKASRCPHQNGAECDARDCVDCASITRNPPLHDPARKQADSDRPQPQPHSHSNPRSNTDPPILLHAIHDPRFLSLVEETKAVIKSPDFEHVLEACLDRATAVLFDGLEKNVFVSSESAPGEELRIRLAGLLPGLARWSRLALNGLPNELIDTVLDVKEVTCLSAIVFSKFEERFRNSPSS